MRSRMMAGIRGKHTKPERVLREMLTGAGVHYRLHRNDLPGSPDIVVPSRQAVIMAHGCFWHSHQGCRFAARPATRSDFWEAKLRGTVDRDEAAEAKLNMLGWRVLVVWECATRGVSEYETLRKQVLSWLASDVPWAEIGERSFTCAPPQ